MRFQMAMLSTRGAAAIVRLLGAYQTHLESAIESTLLPGETQPRAEIDRANVAADRRDWRRAENLVSTLTDAIKQARKAGK